MKSFSSSMNISDGKDSASKSNGRANEDEEGHLTITSTTLPEVLPTLSETNASAVCSDPAPTPSVDSMENTSPRPASEQLDVVPVAKLVEQLKEVETIADESTAKEQIEVTIDQDLLKRPIDDDDDDPMEADENKSEDNAMVIDEKANGDEPTETTTKEEEDLPPPPAKMVR